MSARNSFKSNSFKDKEVLGKNEVNKNKNTDPLWVLRAQYEKEQGPKHVGTGFTAGAKIFAGGLKAGVTGVVSSPSQGVQQQGTVGFMKGMGKGLGGLFYLPVVGTVHAFKELGKGIYNTPDAIRRWKEENEDVDEQSQSTSKSSLGSGNLSMASNETALVPVQQYKAETRRELYSMLFGENFDQKTKSGTPCGGLSDKKDTGNGHVKDTEYYDLLGVPSDASTTTIKKAYFRLAKELHPDKNKGDVDCEQKFLKIGEAYQVLFNPELRARYDEYGKKSVEDEDFIDPRTFFELSFGWEHFSHLIGKLCVVAVEEGAALTPEQLDLLQMDRVEKLSELLKMRLHPWVNGDTDAFIGQALAEVDDLTNAGQLGPQMLQVIGYVYEQHSREILGLHYTGQFTLVGRISSMRAKGHTVKKMVVAATSAAELERLQDKMLAENLVEARKEGATQEDLNKEQAKHAEHILPYVVAALWNISVLDIESTLRSVVEATIMDSSVDIATQKARAKGIAKLGKIIQVARSLRKSWQHVQNLDMDKTQRR